MAKDSVKVELIIPEELYSLVWHDVVAKVQDLQYERVIMSLSELLEGDFFNEYVKTGMSACLLLTKELLFLLLCDITMCPPYICHIFIVYSLSQKSKPCCNCDVADLDCMYRQCVDAFGRSFRGGHPLHT